MFQKNLLYKFLYNFDTVLHQFLETGTSDRTLKGLGQLHKFSGFSLYSLSFLLYSPFKYDDPIVRFDLLTRLLHCKFAQIKINLF